MMNKGYRLNKLELSNFKLFSTTTPIYFNNNDLVVLDGPNGYGKTTVFDAIEILLTGQITHLQNVDFHASRGRKNILANKNGNILIKGYFLDKNYNTMMLERNITSSEFDKDILVVTSTIMFTPRLDDDEPEQISQEELNGILGLTPNENYFNTLFYIQQDKSTTFFSKKENDRKEYIGKLFNTSKQDEELNELLQYQNKLKAFKKSFEDQCKEEPINVNTSTFDEDKIIKYGKLFPNSDLWWDNQKVEMNELNYKKVKLELENLKSFIINQNDFFTFHNNKLITAYCTKGELRYNSLIDLIRYYTFFSKIDELKKQLHINSVLDEFCSLFNTQDLNYGKIIQFSNLNRELLSSFIKINNLLNIIKEQQQLNTTCNEISSLVTSLMELRNSIIIKNDHFNEINKENFQSCPLCGFDYSNTDTSILQEIDKKTNFFNSYLSANETQIQEKWDEYKKSVLDIKLKAIVEYLNGHKVDINFYNNLTNAYINKNEIDKSIKYLEKLKIDFSIYLNNEADNYLSEIVSNNAIEKIIQLILNNKTDLHSLDYSEDNYITHKVVFKECFNNDRQNISKILSELENNLTSIASEYNKFSTEKNKERIKRQNEIKRKLNLVEKELICLEKTKNIYRDAIKDHYDKVIKKIQIPVYIFTGKIIQDYNCGLGLFIKTEDTTDNQKRLKFVTNNDDEHDIVNMFSAGQMAGVSLSMMLAFNMVFSQDKLNIMLIDDPLQCMDDINMVSFVELLRNQREITHKQIIISTHEEETSRYFRYKFHQANATVFSYNVKERFA